MEAWQIIAAAIAGLGFSAVPWIAALLTGRLLTLRVHNERMADKDASIARLERSVTYEQTAKHTQEKRADDAIGALTKLAGEMGQTAVHLLNSLPGVGDEP